MQTFVSISYVSHNNADILIDICHSFLFAVLITNSSLDINWSFTSLQLVSVIHNAYKHHKEMYTRAIVSSFSPLLIYMVSW